MDFNLNDLVKRYKGLLSSAGNTLSSFVQKYPSPASFVQQKAPQVIQQARQVPFNIGTQLQKVNIPQIKAPQPFKTGIPALQLPEQFNALAQSYGRTLSQPSQNKLETGLNVLPFIPVAGVLQKFQKGIQATKILKEAPAIERTLYRIKNYDRMTPNYQVGVIQDTTEKAKSIIPEIVGSKEMKKLVIANPKEWLNTVGKFMEDRLVGARNPKFDLGFSTRQLGKTKPLEPLAQEARKYKSAKEFAQNLAIQINKGQRDSAEITGKIIPGAEGLGKVNRVFSTDEVTSQFEKRFGSLTDFYTQATKGVGGVGGAKNLEGLRQVRQPLQPEIKATQGLKTPLGETPTQAQIQTKIPSSVPIISQKERGFITSVKEAKTTKKDVAEKVEGYYSQRSTPELLQRAQQQVAQGYDVAKQRVFNEPLTDETNAIGQEIMRQAQNVGRYDEAIQMAEELAIKGTQAGQTVQAFSIWSRLTPEGMLRYAQQQLTQASKNIPLLDKVLGRAEKYKAQLTSEDAKIITDLMKKANATPDENLRSQYIKETFEYIGKKLPWGVSDLIDEYRYNNMLSNPLTHLRNAISNLQQTFLTRPATLAAEGRPIEAIKYEMGTLRALPEAFSNFVKSFKGSVPFGKMDIEISKMKPIKPNRLGLLGLPTKSMEASDQFFRTLIKGGEMARGKGVEEAGKMAEYSLFRADLNPQQQGYLLNKIDDVTKAVYQLRKVGLGWFIPFIRTPMNVAKQWIEYSPTGLMTLPGAGDKRAQFAKMIVGSVATAIGANAALEGRTTWSAPTDSKAKELFYASGKKPYSVKIGDKWVPLQTFGVFAWALGLPAAVKYYNDDSRTALTDSQIEKITKSLLSLGGFWSNQTFVSGLGSFVKLAEGDMDYTLPKNVAYTLGQLKPWEGLMRYVSTVIDPIYRKPSGFSQQLQADIPILTKGLPAYRDPMGEPSTRNVTNYISPYGMGQEKPEYNEFYQMRNTQLQNNAVLNKQKKDLENMLNSTNPIGAGAAETSPSGTSMDTIRAKLREDLVKQRVQMTGQPEEINGKYYYQNENGNAVSVELDKKLTKPQLTGQTELDKELISDYNRSITSKINDITKLYELGKFTADEAGAKIKEVSEMKITAPKKPKKITLKKVKVPKIKLVKVKVKKVKIPKPKKVKQYKLKTKKVSKVKLSAKLT